MKKINIQPDIDLQNSREYMGAYNSRDFYKGIEIYKNQLMIIHGTNDQTVPFAISEKYLQVPLLCTAFFCPDRMQ